MGIWCQAFNKEFIGRESWKYHNQATVHCHYVNLLTQKDQALFWLIGGLSKKIFVVQ